MRLRAALVLLIPLALGGCTAPEVPVEAYVEGGAVHFRVPADRLETANCFQYLLVLDARGNPVWDLASDYYTGPHENCPHAFPLRYGVAPRGTQTRGTLTRLARGQLYVIDGQATGRFVGAFRIGADGRIAQVPGRGPEANAALEAYGRAHMVPLDTPQPDTNATAN